MDDGTQVKLIEIADALAHGPRITEKEFLARVRVYYRHPAATVEADSAEGMGRTRLADTDKELEALK
jgi:hypothetical protein